MIRLFWIAHLVTLLVVAVAGLGSQSPVVVVNDIADTLVVLVGDGTSVWSVTEFIFN